MGFAFELSLAAFNLQFITAPTAGETTEIGAWKCKMFYLHPPKWGLAQGHFIENYGLCASHQSVETLCILQLYFGEILEFFFEY